ncbi:protein crumbs [Euwallacea similis]|uniref:protein crumbs n=1 Tax=Euwallacea similis TaxID=1736056 RepID=UPI00345057C5
MGTHNLKICNFFCLLVLYALKCHCLNEISTPSGQPEAYFNSSSYLRLQNSINLRKPVGLSFRTCYGGNLLSQQQTEESIELLVNKKGVLFKAKVDGNSYEEIVFGNFVNNKWHTVFLQYSVGNLTINVDGDIEVIANSSYNTNLLTSSKLYDDMVASVLLVGKNFNGCLLEGPSVVFDPRLIYVNHNVIFEKCPIPIDSCIPAEKMTKIDYCLNEPCMRHGTCINDYNHNTYTCACMPRYTGKNCEIDSGNPCEKRPPYCRNGGTCISDQKGDYDCVCAPGFTGRSCEVELVTHPLCKVNHCLNGGTCDVNFDTGAFRCTCKPGFSGQNCELDIDDCVNKPCLNGGICTDELNNFNCDCSRTGYTGRLCEVNINECIANPCLNGGVCFDTYGSYLCQCASGFGGKNCQNVIDDCASQPCFNNGVCVSKQPGYECKCLPGYYGENCEVENRQQRHCDMLNCGRMGECVQDSLSGATCVCKPDFPGEFPDCKSMSLCSNNPCKNGGFCNIVNGNINCSCPPGYSDMSREKRDNVCQNGGSCVSNGRKSYCLCGNGWTGKNCDRKVACRNLPCVHAISCQDYLGGYYCTCASGWAGTNCELKIGPCFSNPCQNYGVCLERAFGFTCLCRTGFEGTYCQTNTDECQSNPCRNGGVCLDRVNSFYCNCTDDWMGVLCERPYDVCELEPCQNNATCLSTNRHDYTCRCLPGFEGPKCEINKDDCKGVSCPYGQVCYDLINDYECRCPLGFTGDDCTVDIDPCSKGPCVNGSCIVDSTSNEWACKCNPGFTGPLCDMDVDECSIPNTQICNTGLCVNTVGSFRCYCEPGFTGLRCEIDIDECLPQPCQNQATCIDLMNNYTCSCLPGYKGRNCSEEIDECASNPCMGGATCKDQINDFACICPPGLTGKTCNINIDDCESSPCHNGAGCIDGLNEYTCNCTDTGYEGLHCEINIDDCQGYPCLNGAECLDKVKDYDCSCYKGYEGKNCEVDINECESSPCKFGGLCMEKSNITLYSPEIVSKLGIKLPEAFNKPFSYDDAEGYECLCVPGVTGANCEININECESSPCQYGTCTDKIGGYTCECEDGYEGTHCEQDIDECKRYEPCVRGTCVDRVANYFCMCEPEYGGKNCSVKLVGCADEPCQNKGICRPYLVNEVEHKFNCSCPNGYHGYTCENKTTMSFAGNSLVTINTSRDEGYDIQFRFKTTLGDGLLALGKGLTYYILELARGRLNLQSSLLNKWEGVFIGSNLNDSNWQKVFVAINSTHLVLGANEEQTIYPITFNENYNVSSTSFPVTYIGGIPSNLRKLTRGQPFLVGCAEDIQINSDWVIPQSINTTHLTFQNTEIGCVREPQCEPNPCHSGGHCTDKWRDFSCSCTRPFLGNTCQYNYTAATFGHEDITDSLVTVNVFDSARRAIRTIVDISMFIRTRQGKGQIFYLGSAMGSQTTTDENYVAAQLENGELFVRIQFNGSAEAYPVSGVKLDNGYNHLIEVIRNVTLVQVKLNGTEYFRKTISATGILNAQVLFLGGQPQLRSVRQATENLTPKADLVTPTAPAAITSTLSNVNFKGIIQDVQISNGSSIMVVEFFPISAADLFIPPPFGNVSFDRSLVLEGVVSDDLCEDNPCNHNGICENTWNDYRCICTRGFKGKTCNELEFCEIEGCPDGAVCKNLEDGYECIANATFNGKQEPLVYGLTILPNSSRGFNVDEIELTYRTRSWGTLLFAKNNADFFTVFIYHNEVVIQWNLGSGVMTHRFKRDKFEGQWLTLVFQFKDQAFKAGFKENILDQSPNVESTQFDVVSLTELFKEGEIYVAGSDNKTFNFMLAIENTELNTTNYSNQADTTTVDPLIVSNSIESAEMYIDDGFLFKIDQNKKTDKFKGCVSEIRIGGLLLPYFTTKEIYPKDTYSEEFFELQPLVDKVDLDCILCYDNDCNNQGQCINSTETYKCDCNEGYTADDCSIDINECENNQCENGATCVDLIAKYDCQCAVGYEGEHCQIDIDECQSNPCKHGGVCHDLVGTFKCDCPEDFVGKQCEAPLLITCENRPCRDGATCKTGPNPDTGNNFTCSCTEGMQGPLCDTPFCEVDKCKFGFCNATKVPYCACNPGFEGKLCEKNIDECVSVNGRSPCQNGGVCIDGISRYDCNCTSTGYRGLLCEIDIDECGEKPPPCGSGTCENLPGSYRCTCGNTGKCGHHCALDDPCLNKETCQHGVCTSQCTDKQDYLCICDENWTGKNCSHLQEAVTRADSEINILYIIVPVVLILILGFLIGMIILVNVARSKRATRGTYSPSAQEFCNPRVELDHVLKPPPEERLI